MSGDGALLLVWPFLTGLAVLATHVPLGRRVLARGIIFLDLAVAQLAVLGVIAAHAAELGGGAPATQLAATAAALAGALGLAACEARWPQLQEALIGSTFVVAASLAILLLAGDPHGSEHMTELLSGQILWTTPQQTGRLAALSLLLLGVLAWRAARLGPYGFYVLFALAITASVQLVGVYLVFASLILPALAVRHLAPPAALAAGWLLGALGYAAGLAASLAFDWPAGPAVVTALAGVALLSSAARAVAGNRRRR
jgi:zinc/manganese transport system permease protein